ncbi:Potassium transporter [Blastocladiella emersonii ATCC 22665]|nr:Potassium transporter [Blastocladiella emersonii ATCC 22665]
MGCCFSTAKWKREEVPDHKFDFVDIDEYKERDLWPQIAYTSVFLMTFRSVLVYMADVSTAVLIIVFNQWSLSTRPETLANNKNLSRFLGISSSTFASIVTNIRWVYIGSILVSFLLLAMDAKKARRIIRSRDISFAFTHTQAYTYYCLRSFAHWCFFRQVRSQHKTSDQVALFVFFRLKGWKRLLFAETPRHLINAALLSFHVWETGKDSRGNFDMDRFVANSKATMTTQFGVFVMAFVLTMYMINLLSTILAALVYVPLLCRMRGNLKEYVCHLIDKRISELMKRKARRRIQEQHKELAIFGTTKEAAAAGGPKATLPVLTEYGNVAPSPGLVASSSHATGTTSPSTHHRLGGGGGYYDEKSGAGTGFRGSAAVTKPPGSPGYYANQPPPGSPRGSPAGMAPQYGTANPPAISMHATGASGGNLTHRSYATTASAQYNSHANLYASPAPSPYAAPASPHVVSSHATGASGYGYAAGGGNGGGYYGTQQSSSAHGTYRSTGQRPQQQQAYPLQQYPPREQQQQHQYGQQQQQQPTGGRRY